MPMLSRRRRTPYVEHVEKLDDVVGVLFAMNVVSRRP